MRVLVALLLVLATGCPSEPDATPPQTPSRRQLDLSERILAAIPKLAKEDAGTQADAALALGEVAVPGHSPRLRLIAAGDNAIIGRGAAVALVRIRLLREPGQATLSECVKNETNQWVREECARRLAAPAPAAPGAAAPTTPPPGTLELLDSKDPEARRAGVRRLLAAPETTTAIDVSVEGRLVHFLSDDDPRLRILTEAVFLRRSLAQDPPPIVRVP